MELDDKVFVVNNKEYLVITSVNYINKNYVYLVNKADESDAMYREVVKENNDVFLQTIDPNLFNNRLLTLFIKEFI